MKWTWRWAINKHAVFCLGVQEAWRFENTLRFLGVERKTSNLTTEIDFCSSYKRKSVVFGDVWRNTMFFKIVFFHFCIKNESCGEHVFFSELIQDPSRFMNYSLYDWIVAVEIFCLYPCLDVMYIVHFSTKLILLNFVQTAWSQLLFSEA